jgi:hypothetical protein
VSLGTESRTGEAGPIWPSGHRQEGLGGKQWPRQLLQEEATLGGNGRSLSLCDSSLVTLRDLVFNLRKQQDLPWGSEVVPGHCPCTVRDRMGT